MAKKTVGLYLDEELIRRLKKLSHERSIIENRDVTSQDLIRGAIERVYFMGGIFKEEKRCTD